MKFNKQEQVTSDNIPDVLGTVDPYELRLKRDKLLQRRLKQNPDLKSKLKIGEQMITTVTFTSDSAFAIDKQYSLLKMMGSEIASNWEFSDISSSASEDGSSGTESFTITSRVHDNNLSEDYLNHYLMSGVTMNIVKNNDKELEQENVVNSILEMNLDPAKMANLLLGESKVQLKESIGDLYYEFPIMSNYISQVKEELDAAIEIKVPFKYKFLKSENNTTSVRVQIVKGNEPDQIFKMNAGILVQALNVAIKHFPKNSISSSKALDLLEPYKINSMNEQEEPDSTDSESGVIDDVQSMLVKMLPMTKGLDLSPEKEQELKKHIDAALAIFNSDKTEAVDYPQFQFAVMVAREDYADAIRILNENNIKPKTTFNNKESTVLGFDSVQSDDAGVPKLTEEQVIKLLADAGIAAVSAAGVDFTYMISDPDQEADELDGSDELDPEDLIARTEAIILGKKKK